MADTPIYTPEELKSFKAYDATSSQFTPQEIESFKQYDSHIANENSVAEAAAYGGVGAGLASLAAKGIKSIPLFKNKGVEEPQVEPQVAPQAAPVVETPIAPIDIPPVSNTGTSGSPYGFGEGAVANAEHNVDQIVGNKVHQNFIGDPNFKVGNNLKIATPSGFDTEAYIKAQHEKPAIDLHKGRVQAAANEAALQNEARMTTQLKAAKAAKAAKDAEAASLSGKIKAVTTPIKNGVKQAGKAAQWVSDLPVIGHALAGAGVAGEAQDAYNRFQNDDYLGGTVSGLGALGSAASVFPAQPPWLRGAEAGLGMGAPLLNTGIDYVKKKFAEGGEVGPAPSEGGINYRDYPNPYQNPNINGGGLRAYLKSDGTYGGEMIPKSTGLLDELQGTGPNAGKSMTEYSIGDETGDYPSLVPTLNSEDIKNVLNGNITPEVAKKAREWSDTRKSHGMSPFYNPPGFAEGGEVDTTLPPVGKSPRLSQDEMINNALNQPSRADVLKRTASILGHQALDQGKKEFKSYSKPHAFTDVANDWASTLAGAPVDLTNTVLQPFGLGSDNPVLGSKYLKDLMVKNNMHTGEDRPMTNLATSFIMPQTAAKGVVKGSGWLGKEALRQVEDRSGLLGNMTMDPRQYVVKGDGGQWMPSSVSRLERGLNDRYGNAGISNWLQTTGKKYILNRAGTPSDEIRLLADQGITHIPPEESLRRFEQLSKPSIKDIVKARIDAGFPGVGHAETNPGSMWEANADMAIQPYKASQLAPFKYEMPWLDNLDPNTPVHDFTFSDTPNILGMDHLANALRSDISSGKLRPEQLNKVSISDAVKRAHQQRGQLEQNRIQLIQGVPTVKEYPNGYHWKELTHQDPATLDSILKSEGETMQNCIGGYCSDVLEDGTKLYSLRDPAGNPHANVEVRPGYEGPEVKQIKGKQNEAPNAYQPYIQDFVQNPVGGQEFFNVNDLENTGLMDVGKLKSHGLADLPPGAGQSIDAELGRIHPRQPGQFGGFESSGQHGVRVPSYQLLKNLTQDLPGNYVNEQQLLNHLQGKEARPVEESYSNFYDQPTGMASGGAVQHYAGGKLVAPMTALGKMSDAYRKAEAMVRAENEGNRLSKAQSTAAGFYHPIGGGLKLDQPVGDFSRIVKDDPRFTVQPTNYLSPLDLYGKKGLPLIGDRTDGAKILTHVNGIELSKPVNLEAGRYFNKSNTYPDQPEKSSGWASHKAVITKLNNRVEKAGESGDDVLGINVLGTPRNVDFNNMMSQALLGQMHAMNIHPNDINQFNEHISSLYPSAKFLGIDHPDVLDQITKPNMGPLRTSIVQEMAKGDYPSKGFPNVAATRAAITDQDLMDVPTHATGLSITKMNPDNPVVANPIVQHGSFPVHQGGEYAGEFELPFNYTDFFTDFKQNRLAENKPENGDYYGFLRGLPIQDFNQKWLDDVMPTYEQIMQSKLAKGGHIKSHQELISEMDPSVLRDILQHSKISGSSD